MKRLNTNQDTKDLAVTLAGNCSAALCYFVAMENNNVHFILDGILCAWNESFNWILSNF